MAQVTVKINGYAYTVGCEDGQEPHLLAMAEQVESRIESIKALGGHSGEARLLVMAALLMADELHDMRRARSCAPLQRAAPSGGKPRPSRTNRRERARRSWPSAPRRLRRRSSIPRLAMAGLPGASGNSSPGPISTLPGAGSVVILVTVSGAHLHKQALGG